MKKSILHLSHTDIRSDSRILKEIEVISRIDGVSVYGVGLALNEELTPSRFISGVRVDAVKLQTKVLRWLPNRVRHFFNFLELNIRFFFRGLGIRPSVIHCHDTLVLPIGVVLKIFTGSSLIYDAHELESSKNGQTRFLSVLVLTMERMCWNSVDHFITVSDKIVEWYHERLGVKPFTLILNSPQISGGEFKVRDESNFDLQYLRRKFSIPKHARIFLYLGIIGKGRGIEMSLEAFSRSHPDAHFVMVGYGPLVPMAKEVASRSRNIHYHEAVPHDEVVTIASSADVGLCLIENVSLSDYYCLPNKLFEYAFAGLYVLSCNFPEIRRVVDRHGLGSTCDLDADSLVAEIERICIQGAHHEARDLDLLSWDTQAVRLMQTYSNLLAQ